MKIVVALPRFPFPGDKGDRLRAWKQVQFLAARHEVHLLCLEESAPDAEGMREAQALCASVTVVQQGRMQRMGNLVRALFNALPFQVNYYRSARAKQKLSDLLARVKPDALYVQLVRMGENLPDTQGIRCVLDYMDAFSAGMEKRIAHEKFWARPWVRKEARRLKRYEAAIASRFDACTIISAQDRGTLPAAVQARTTVVPNGVNELFLEGGSEEKQFDLLFTGNLGYHPNIVAAQFLVQKVMPLLEAKGHQLKVCLAGARPAPQLLALANERITVVGPVPDLRPYFRRSRLFVAPLMSGSGMQNKLLESMAMGLPTLTTPLSAAALSAEPGTHLIVCKDETEFANEIIQLLTHPAQAAALAERGRDLVASHYSWTQMNEILEKVISGKPL